VTCIECTADRSLSPWIDPTRSVENENDYEKKKAPANSAVK